MIKRQNAKILIIIITVLTILALISISTIIILQGVWDFIGINNTNKINIDNTVCSISYVNIKYQNYITNKQIFITLIAISLAFVFTASIIGFIIMFLVFYFLQNDKKPQQLLTPVTQYKMYFLIALNSIDLSCLIIHLGHFLSFYLQIPDTCSGSSDLVTQIIAIFALSVFALLLMFVVWILLLRMNAHVLQYLKQNQIVDLPLKIKTKQTQGQLATDIEMQEKAQLAEARKQIQNNQKSKYSSINNYISGPNIYNQNSKIQNENNISKNIKNVIKLQEKNDKQKQGSALRNTLLNKYNNSPTSLNRNIKSQMYYGNFKQLNQRNKNSSEKQDVLIYHKPRFQTPQKHNYQQQSHRKIKLYDQNQFNNDNSKKKLQTSYFRQTALKNKNYDSPEIRDKQRQNQMFHKNLKQDQKRSSLYFPNNRTDDSHYSPIQREYNKSSPKNMSSLNKKQHDDHYTLVSRIQKTPYENKKRLSSQKPRKGMLIDYIRERYVE